jgi:hypothetical protein
MISIDRIDFISSYCDRWCERCAFTSRCSAYAVDIATAMCDGDREAGLELAVGTPPPEGEAEAARREVFLASLPNEEPSEEEMERYAREQEARDERLDESPITTGARKVTLLAGNWLGDHREKIGRDGDQQVKDAIEVAGWDAYFIAAKLHRALRGRDEYLQDEDVDDDPVQNDWNGSAKVALISIERSKTAWEVLAQATGDAEAMAVVEELRTLQQQVEQAFPDAWKFIRPGFDDPHD